MLVLSNLAKIYNPLGWLSADIIVGKLFMQRLWLEGIDWDQELEVNDLNELQLYEENLTKQWYFEMNKNTCKFFSLALRFCRCF